MIKLGSNNIGKIYLGSNQIGKAYLGNSLVYQNGGVVIPDGPVEYIETDGAAYIDTGIIGEWPKSCEMKVLIVNTDFACFLGSRVANNGMRFQPVMNMSNRVDFGTSEAYYNGVDITDSITNRTPVLVRASLKKASGSYIAAKQEGESEYTSMSGTAYPSGSSPTTDLNMFLFALNNGGVASGFEPSGTRLYYCKIYGDDSLTNLIFDGVPYVYHGKYGLWDNVTNTFFGNANSSGAFSGTSSAPEPDIPYTLVDYIVTDGVAYINTNIIGAPDKSAEIKILPIAGDATYLGSWGSSTDGEAKKFAMFRLAPFSSDDSYRLGFGYYYSALNTDCPSITNSILNGTPFVARGSLKSGAQIISVKEQGESDFTSYSRSYTKAISSSLNMFLLALNNNGSVSQVAKNGTRLYYCKIYSDADYSTLVFDGVPCYYNGAYGLWDRITDSFFGNAAGSGAFTGPQI